MLKNLTFAFFAVALSVSAAPAFATPHDDHFQASGDDAFRNDPPADNATAAWCSRVLAAPNHYPANQAAYCRAVVNGY